MSDDAELPTPEGCRRYPPSGYDQEGNACTCEKCPNPCNGAFCGCDACYDGHEVLDHPTHHRPLMIASGVAAAIGFAIFIPLSRFGHSMLAAGLGIAMILGIIIAMHFYCRHCACPRCRQRLPCDPRSPRGSYFYFCRQCHVLWESRIRSG